MASRTGPRAAWACSGVGPEGLDGLGQGLELVGIGGLADGVEDGAEGGLGLLGRGTEGLDGLGQGLELVGVGGLADGIEDGAEGGLGLLGRELGPEGLDGLGQGLELAVVGGLGMASRTGPRAAWACSGASLGPRVWTAWARARSLSRSVVWRMASRTGAEGGLGLLGVGAEGLDGLGQGLELVIGGLADGVEDGAEGGLGLLGRVWDRGSGRPGPGPGARRDRWSGGWRRGRGRGRPGPARASLGPRVWTAWARAWSADGGWSGGWRRGRGRGRPGPARGKPGPEGLDGLGQGLELVGIGGLADGVEDRAEEPLDGSGVRTQPEGAQDRCRSSGQGVDLIAIQRELLEEGVTDGGVAGGQIPKARTEASDARIVGTLPSKSSRLQISAAVVSSASCCTCPLAYHP